MPFKSKKTKKVIDTISKVGGLGIVKEGSRPPAPAPQAPSLPASSPSVPKHRTVKFESDKTVTVDGVNLTRAQYDATIAAQGGGARSTGAGAQITPEVQQVIEAQRVRDQGQQPLTPGQVQNTLASLDVGQIQPDGQPLGDTALNLGGAGAAGAAAGYAGFLSAASIGASAGAATGPLAPVAIPIGILAGLAAAGGKLSFDERQQTKEAYKNYNNAVKGLSYAQALANSGNSAQAIELWRIHKRNLLISQAQLKEKTKGAVGRQLSGAMEEYSTVNDYINNYLPSEELAFAIALQNPNPTKVNTYMTASAYNPDNQNGT